MKLERLNIRSIDKLLAGVRSGPLSPPFTNYFRQPMTGDVILGARTASTAVFINDDGDFFRLYFRSVDLADLSARSGIEAMSHFATAIDQVTTSGLATLEGTLVRATARGFRVLDQVASAFVSS